MREIRTDFFTSVFPVGKRAQVRLSSDEERNEQRTPPQDRKFCPGFSLFATGVRGFFLNFQRKKGVHSWTNTGYILQKTKVRDFIWNFKLYPYFRFTSQT